MKIHFKNKLPSMWADGKHQNGLYNNPEMVLPMCLTTKDSELGVFLHDLNNAVHEERRLVFIDDKVLVCYLNWIRDHVHMMKAFKHWEYDLKSFLDFILQTQRADGQYYELIKQTDDEHWKFVNEDCYIKYPKDNVVLIRLELEADIEYLVVEGAMQYYRVTGDTVWIEKMLPKLEKGIDYITSDEKRFDREHGLIKRPFTIDTWDFTDSPESDRDRRIAKDEKMSIMHGDNSGVYQAMRFLAFFNRLLGNENKAVEWERRAQQIKVNMDKYLWNGKFYIHQLHLNHAGLDDKENIRLSLSNPYDINRGVTEQRQSESIIQEYIERRHTTKGLAEWFSIDPPYNSFQRYKSGEYVNGAVSPFAAGELAKAAFDNGYEEYGYDIIKRFIAILKRDQKIFFLYSPNGSPQGRGPSGWGAASLLNAVDEGLAGIVDVDHKYKEIFFSPKFVVTEYTELRYITGYERSKVFVDMRFILTEKGMRYDLYSKIEKIRAHILLPKNKTCKEVYVNNEKTDFTCKKIRFSNYVDFFTIGKNVTSIEIFFV